MSRREEFNTAVEPVLGHVGTAYSQPFLQNGDSSRATHSLLVTVPHGRCAWRHQRPGTFCPVSLAELGRWGSSKDRKPFISPSSCARFVKMVEGKAGLNSLNGCFKMGYTHMSAGMVHWELGDSLVTYAKNASWLQHPVSRCLCPPHCLRSQAFVIAPWLLHFSAVMFSTRMRRIKQSDGV